MDNTDKIRAEIRNKLQAPYGIIDLLLQEKKPPEKLLRIAQKDLKGITNLLKVKKFKIRYGGPKYNIFEYMGSYGIKQVCQWCGSPLKRYKYYLRIVGTRLHSPLCYRCAIRELKEQVRWENYLIQLFKQAFAKKRNSRRKNNKEIQD